MVVQKKKNIPGRIQKGQVLNPNGRPKGSKNRFTTLKQAFLNAFVNLGGEEGLTEWAKRNRVSKSEFYKLVTKMLPREVHVAPDSELSPGNLTALKDEELDAIINNGR